MIVPLATSMPVVLASLLDSLPPWLVSLLVLLAIAGIAVLAGILFERIVIATARRLVKKTKTDWDDLILHAVHPAIALLVVVVVFQLGLVLAGAALPDLVVEAWGRLALGIGIVLFAVLATRLMGGLLRRMGQRHARMRSVARLGARFSNVIVYTMAFLVILGSYGIAITPLITSLGIAGLAVALALQDTLSNFFAGVWIQTGRSMEPGHYVKLEGENLEGYIEEVGWRTTRIRQLGNNITIVPNARMAQTIVTDYHLPVPRMSLLIPIGVGYECDPRHVEAVLVDEAKRAAGQVEGLLADPAPFVRFIPGFGDFSLQFTLICHVREYVDQYLAQHELRMRILDRFRKEGIRIPYPIRETYTVPSTRPDVATGPVRPVASDGVTR